MGSRKQKTLAETPVRHSVVAARSRQAPPAAAVLELQQTHGNRAVAQLLRESWSNHRSPCGMAGGCAGCRARAAAHRQTQSRAAREAVQLAVSSPGQPLDAAVREDMERAFDHDFRDVRVRDDVQGARSARAIGAAAYSVGQHVVMGAGKFRPHTTDGRALLAHELAHVVQQQAAPIQTGPVQFHDPRSAELEREAQVAGQQVAKNQPAPAQPPASGPGIHRQMLVEEPAGGCGICMDPMEAGRLAHGMIEAKHTIIEAMHERERAGPSFLSPSEFRYAFEGGAGRPDLVDINPTARELTAGEIKPARASSMQRGEKQLERYLAGLRQTHPDYRVALLERTIPNPIGPFPDPGASPACQEQRLYVNQPVRGVYGYYCQPTRRELRSLPGCGCGSEKREPKHVPVRVRERERVPEERRGWKPEPPLLLPIVPPVNAPANEVAQRPPSLPPVLAPQPSAAQRKEILRTIGEFLRSAAKAGEETHAAAARFLQEHPEVVRYLLVAAAWAVAITIVAATLVEDVATLGAGVVNDPATIGLAVTLIRVAQAMPAAA